MTLPLKLRILQYAMDKKESVTVDEIMKVLASEYGGEKQFNAKRVTDYLDTFLGVQFMKADKVEFDKDNNLIIHYIITDYGLTRQKYIHS